MLASGSYAPSIRTSAEPALEQAQQQTVKAALRHESADSEEDREGLGCHLGQGLTGSAVCVCVCVCVCACGTAQVQVEGQQQVDEEIRQLLCGVGGQAVLNHVQQEPQERAVEML